MTTLIDQKNATPNPPSLYEGRKQIYPKLAHGKFRMVKWIVMAATLGVYYLLPWIRWPRGEGIPDQAVLADFAGEKFYFFWFEIWPQELYYLAGLLILGALGLFLVTSLFGRVWCGYTCPQTVWTDLYIWVERAFEGDRAARMRLDAAPWSFNKLWRKLGKHLVWLIIAFWTGGAFILYWHDAPTVAKGWFTGEAPLTAYFFAGVLTITTYFLAGWMREQVCTYMCPWPRIQGALTDENALNVTYRYDRGEPRGPHHKGESWEGRGDCIDCKQCVQVCPMGIDIRDGSQLACIHCALCIDACDDIMKKIGRPTGLIAYDTDFAVAARAAGQKPKYHIFRPRTILYLILMGAIASMVGFGYFNKSTFEVNVLKDRSPPFVRLSSGDIRNGYTLKLVNKASKSRHVLVAIEGLDNASVQIIGVETEADGKIGLDVSAHGVDRFRMLVTRPGGDPVKRSDFTVTVTDTATGESEPSPAVFVEGAP
ncbi:MAG: cytochrome c oxidase accessory protein CcoG [Hyphomonas sp.]|nr:cytochrome c oxidase accessory protein CcoG [Hyphomonas sp.]MCB9971582.1 cytochrome c oxidase accessory protein CcoG [Hyphomonas sp.]